MNNAKLSVSTEPKVLFLQEDFGCYPKGLAIVEVDKTPLHILAESLVGSPVEPCGFYVAYQGDKDDVIRIPRFGGLVRDSHPNAKEVTGPFVAGEIRTTMDRLPEAVFAIVTFTKNWPRLDAVICYNDLKPKEGKVKTEAMTNCHGEEDFWNKILDEVQKVREE